MTTDRTLYISVDMEEDLKIGMDVNYQSLRGIIDRNDDLSDWAATTLARYVEACSAAWVAQAERFGYNAIATRDDREHHEQRRRNDPADLGMNGDEAYGESNVQRAWQRVWDTVDLPGLSKILA